jgi:hypothetical protein
MFPVSGAEQLNTSEAKGTIPISSADVYADSVYWFIMRLEP